MTIESLPVVQTLEELVKQYYREVPKSACVDKEALEKCITINLAIYNNVHPSSYKLPLNLTREEEIKELLSGSHFVDNKKVCKYLRQYNDKGLQNLPVLVAEYLEQGYKVVPNNEINLHQYFKQNWLIMEKPQEIIDAEIADIKKGIEALFKEKAEIERKNLMSAEKAMEYAKAKHAEQEETYNTAITLEAAAEAEKQAEFFTKYNGFVNEIEAKDFWFFDDVKALTDSEANADIEKLLTQCGFISVRKYLADGKQKTLWVKQELADSYDYKSITL
ncbi:hypothetical protein Q5V23_004421 [Vibrio fluvialis]|nr:hypothetical protein [Vibrio fluvialis]ELL4670527.1 hypothetical protein [Vibrio fluvialis]